MATTATTTATESNTNTTEVLPIDVRDLTFAYPGKEVSNHDDNIIII
jgi:hypothetical protein